MDFQKGKLKELFQKKCEIKEIEFNGIDEIFPDDIFYILKPYWDQELGRLMNPLPDLQNVLNELRAKLEFLD